MARKNLLLGLDEDELTLVNSSPDGPSSQSLATRPTLGGRGAVGAMSRSLERISADIDAAKALEQRLLAGADVVELDASTINSSFVSDRLDDGAEDCAVLAASIREHGQQVPILVRPHPEKLGQYQVSYGHRRLRVLRELGLKVRAVVRSLTDEQLVIAQGQENSARRDLSFIERASFASLLEDRGFGRETIMAALTVDKTELSRLISCRRSLPDELVHAIGAAPKAGRRRWMEMADCLQESDASESWLEIRVDPAFQKLDSDARFLRIFAAISNRKSARKAPAWIDAGGKKIARIDDEKGWFRISIDKSVDADFGAFLVDQLPALLRAHRGVPDRS
ncbi:plasmid partitioning protein RepB [Methylocystis heyeri]|uniref:plasmid partitioning protein RepB n=1 Tax=Methylocystis heyeri TaxID=391905 RepID=UPI001FEC0667|nr:plasmid partitioning protein RepB [Methylocystis heyeri]